MKIYILKYWPILLIIAINIVFFSRLFFPEVKIFVTPDFGLSDLTHFNFPLRKVFAESIKNHTLPLWDTKIGSGLPLFAEGQTGIFNIINLFTSYFFPLAIGFNLTYLVSYLLMGVATFLFCQLIKLSKIASLLTAIVFSFCGYNITHFAHTHHIVTAAFLPVMFLVLEKALQTKRKVWWAILAIAAAQALLGGNIQVAAYSFLALGFYLLYRGYRGYRRDRDIRKIGVLGLSFTFSFILAFSLSAIQLLPSLELSSTSFRQGGLPEQELKQFPYPIKHLLTFLNPYLLGDSHKATYERYNEDWGLFWENTAYIGVIPLVLAILAVAFSLRSCAPMARLMGGRGARSYKKGQEKQSHVLFFGFLALFTLLLSLGKYTPLFYLLKLPILNLFRIPSTFLFVTDFALAILAGFGLDALIKKLPKRNLRFTIYDLRFTTLFAFLLFTFSLLDLMVFGYNYNPIGKAKDWEKPPEVVEFLQKDGSDYRIYDLLSAVPWNNRFSDYGWENDASEYLRFREGLKPDINLLWDINSANSYTGFEPERLSHFKYIIDQTILVDQGKKLIYLTKQAQDLFNMQSIKYFISPYEIVTPGVKLVFQTNYSAGANYFVYENINFLERARIVGDFVVKEDLQDVDRTLFSGTLNPETQVILEVPLSLETETDVSSAEVNPVKADVSSAHGVKILEENSTYLKLRVESSTAGILVLADTFYPGWTAKVNSKATEILPANLTQRAVIIPANTSTIEFSYETRFFKIGAIISGSSLLLILGFLFVKLKRTMLKEEIYSQLSKICQQEFGVVPKDFVVEHPADPNHGDYASNIAMVLAKEHGKNPMEIAETIVTNYHPPAGGPITNYEKIEVVIPGFINFWLSKEFLFSQLQEIVSTGTGFAETPHAGKKYMVEFAHPNTLKPFHIGHLRNISIGESVVRLLESQNIKVVRANYQGDVGLHIAKALWALAKVPAKGWSASGRKSLEERINLLGKTYTQGNKAYEENERTKEEIMELNKKIYEEDPEIMPLWKETRKWSLDYFEEIYRRVGTHFDRYFFESEVAGTGKKIVLEFLKKGVFEKSEGAVIFNGEKFGFHKRVFINKAGFPTYEAKDLGLAPLQFFEYDLDKCIHVVGPEQKGYFEVLFKALEFTEPTTKGKEEHLMYGWVRLKQGKMSSRAGSVVTASWLLNEIKNKVFAMIDVNKEYSKEEKEIIAEKVTIAAAKYSLLKFAPNTEIAFDIDESISLTGNSGPYLQYTFARTLSVLRKVQSGKKTIQQFNNSTINPEEMIILRTIYKFPEVVAEATENYAPNLICNFLFDLAQKFNTFYEKWPIIKAESEEARNLRLNLTTATGQILKNGLYLLGIEVPEQM